jgi:hypothetical protein
MRMNTQTPHKGKARRKAGPYPSATGLPDPYQVAKEAHAALERSAKSLGVTTEELRLLVLNDTKPLPGVPLPAAPIGLPAPLAVPDVNPRASASSASDSQLEMISDDSDFESDDFSSANGDLLDSHAQSLGGPSECLWQGCNKKAGEYDSLHKHLEQHIPRRVKKHQGHECLWKGCERTFKKRSDFIVHVQQDHAHFRAFSCPFGPKNSEFYLENPCGSSFARRTMLKRHMLRVHNAAAEYIDDALCARVREYRCMVVGCSSLCATMDGLHAHMLVKHNINIHRSPDLMARAEKKEHSVIPREEIPEILNEEDAALRDQLIVNTAHYREAGAPYAQHGNRSRHSEEKEESAKRQRRRERHPEHRDKERTEEHTQERKQERKQERRQERKQERKPDRKQRKHERTQEPKQGRKRNERKEDEEKEQGQQMDEEDEEEDEEEIEKEMGQEMEAYQEPKPGRKRKERTEEAEEGEEEQEIKEEEEEEMEEEMVIKAEEEEEEEEAEEDYRDPKRRRMEDTPVIKAEPEDLTEMEIRAAEQIQTLSFMFS